MLPVPAHLSIGFVGKRAVIAKLQLVPGAAKERDGKALLDLPNVVERHGVPGD